MGHSLSLLAAAESKRLVSVWTCLPMVSWWENLCEGCLSRRVRVCTESSPCLSLPTQGINQVQGRSLWALQETWSGNTTPLCEVGFIVTFILQTKKLRSSYMARGRRICVCTKGVCLELWHDHSTDHLSDFTHTAFCDSSRRFCLKWGMGNVPSPWDEEKSEQLPSEHQARNFVESL